MSFRKHSSVSQRRSYIPACVGDARKGKKIANSFGALSLSDSEEEVRRPLQKQPLTLQEADASDPYVQAMLHGGIQWGDLLTDEDNGLTLAQSLAQVAHRARLDGKSRAQAAAAHAAREAAAEAARIAEEIAIVAAHNEHLDRMYEKEEEFYQQDFMANVGECGPCRYNTAELTDAEYEGCMTWLYANGWNVAEESRDFIHTWADTLPPRVWIPMSAAVAVAPAQKEKKKEKVTVPRFCVKCDAANPAPTCRYVHGDSMSRLDKPCGFGEACGASDPTGVKRTQCLYMHPGEIWSADLVITRPVV